MSTGSPIARSPIAPAAPTAVVDGWEVSTRRSEAALRIADHTPLAKVVIKGSETTPGRVPWSRAERHDEVLEISSGPGEWTLIGPVGSAPSLVDGIDTSTGFVSVVDITHGRALMRLSGESTVGVLAKICALDLADDRRPNGSSFRTSVAKLVTDVVRDDLTDGTRSYLLHCDRSSGQYLFDCILDAGAEFGIDVDGFHP